VEAYRILTGWKQPELPPKVESPAVSGFSTATEKDEANIWKLARGQNRKITVENQMFTLLANDDLCASWDSKKVAEVLGCSESAVRKKKNKAWRMFKEGNAQLQEESRQRRRNGNLSQDTSEDD